MTLIIGRRDCWLVETILAEIWWVCRICRRSTLEWKQSWPAITAS